MSRSSVSILTGFGLLTALPAFGQLTLNQVGGTISGGNLGTSATSFAFDVIGGGTLAPTHTIANINNGTYGNPSSWIGDSNNSFVGLNFGATAVPIGRVAWGRDNTATFFDRSAGVYTMSYTQVPNPGAGLADTGNPATGWTTIGSVNYLFQGAAGSPISMSSRHLWSFPSVNATGVRLTAPGSSFANGAAIDELEVYPAAPVPLSLVTTGGAMSSSNIGLTSTAFARDVIGGGAFAPTHTIANINDGLYGNGDSWIGDTESSYLGLDFNGSFTVNRVAFGRDNTGTFADRSGGTYLIQYTTIPDPDALTVDANWTTIGSVYYDHNGADSAVRHEYSFDPVTATGIRMFVSGNGIGTGIAVDELEAYAVPEASVPALLLLTGAALCRRKRSLR